MRYFLTLVAVAAFSAFAESDPAKETQELLRNARERQKLIQQDPKSREADDQVKALAGTPENTEAIYGLAADVMGTLSKQAEGDPNKMDEILQRAMENPEGFANSFTPEQKQQLRELGMKIEVQRKQTP